MNRTFVKLVLGLSFLTSTLCVASCSVSDAAKLYVFDWVVRNVL